MGVCCIVFDIDGMLFEFFMNFLNIEKCPFTYWLNGRWFLQIVEREFEHGVKHVKWKVVSPNSR